jgi:hypothetical protein
MILVHGDFRVPDGRNVFNDDTMVDFTAVLVVEEDFVGSDNVVDDR